MRAAVLVAAALAAPLPALAAGTGAAVVTPQVARLLGEGPETAMGVLVDLMERIGRGDGMVIDTLTEDRDAAHAARVVDAIEHLVTLDTGGDGALTRLEVSRAQTDWTAGHLQTFFEEFDRDGDGRVDRAEIEEGVELRAMEVGSTAILEDIVSWDLDADGTVTPEEVRTVVLANPAAAVGN